MRESVNELPVIHRATVVPDWIDYNGHFNAGYYAVVFDTSVGPWLSYCGLTTEHRQSHRVTTFTAESHALYLREVHEGDELEITGQLLDFTDKKIHSLLRMYTPDDEQPRATYEVMTLHIDRASRRPGPMHGSVIAGLKTLMARHGRRPWPPQAGRVISVTANRPADE